MAPLPDYKDIVDLIKKGATVEAQEKIMELRVAVVDLKEENVALRERVKTLEATLDLRSKLTFRDRLYWITGDSTPFCPQCWEDKQKPIHLHGGRNQQRFHCTVCDFIDSNHD